MLNCIRKIGLVGIFLSLFMAVNAYADICFAPSGGCQAINDGSTFAPRADKSCRGYDAYPKQGDGWNCSPACESRGKQYYKCVEKQCPDGYYNTVKSCICGYELKISGMSGYDECGRCEPISQCKSWARDYRGQPTNNPDCGGEENEYISVEMYFCTGDETGESKPCYACYDNKCNAPLGGLSNSNNVVRPRFGATTKAECKSYEAPVGNQWQTAAGNWCVECCDDRCSEGEKTVNCDEDTQIEVEITTTDCGTPCLKCEDKSQEE